MNDENKTRKIERPFPELQAADLPQQRDRDPEETRKLPPQSEDPNRAVRPPKVDDNLTRIHRPKPRSTEEAGYHPLSTATEVPEETADPVVGWLVVVKGPGRGNAVRLGYHWNSIGRNADQRVSLNFGDPQISRQNHAKLNYEPRARKFTITIGDGINPTYVRGENLLGPTEIKSGDRIELGETELMFVALCGETFDWDSHS